MTRVLRPRSTDASRIPMEGWAARRIVVMAEERAKPELWTDSWRNWTSSGTPWQAAWDYWVDAAQRTVLFCDVMRKRGNMFLEHEAKGKPPVLAFEQEMVLDGRTLGRPVNYFLIRIIPQAGTRTDPRKRPFVVFDPRAGHGPGIGGSKVDSEIGVALRAGHPCYFVGFRAEPVPGQTLEDVGRAEGLFLQKIAELHPEADGRPCIVGNCQAGWAVMMLSAVAPDLMGPILLAGAPLSYWAGAGTQNPMRYAGGMLGGSWLASLAGDLGNGRFDGVHLVANFENLNPANTLWKKPYNLYAKIDTEEPRYLDFERWWGGFFLPGRIAQREHSEIVQALDVIETLPPGLWEMVIEDKQPGASHAELMPGRYLVRFERRSLNDIRVLEDTREDERPFAAVARVSEIAESWYRTFVSPWIRPWVTEPVAEALRNLHPNRLQYSLCSDRNPWMAGVKDLAEVVRQHRKPAAPENPFLAVEQKVSAQIEHALETYRDVRDRTTERLFNAIYGSAWLQAAVGLSAAAGDGVAVPPRDETFEALLAQKIAALRMRMDQGGLREAAVRILLYAGSDEPRVDVRGFRMAEQVRDKYLAGERLPGPQRRELFREQFFLLLLDEAGALAALPRMLRSDGERATALEMVRQVLSAKGELSEERRARLARVERILNESPAIPAPVA